jgi:hypothetical protein
MPMDRNAALVSLMVAIENELGRPPHEVDLLPEDGVDALCGNDMRIVSRTPTAAACALASSWRDQCAWRSDDPRATAVIVVHTGKEAAVLRSLGFTASTAFAWRRDRLDVAHGLVVVADSSRLTQDDMAAVVDGRAGVRLVIVDDPRNLPDAR